MALARGTTLEDLARDLSSGKVTSRFLVEGCLEKIEAETGEGARAFVAVDAAGARAAADAVDRNRGTGRRGPRFSGIPISIKDLFDIAGQVTCAGSRTLEGSPSASSDAPSVARLRNAGFIMIGRTNMTEFAFSGLGLNPHFGTPKNPWHRERALIPGGSSSGAAVSVADEMAHAALGTDTGGSCRIPAAFTGLTGFKPTASRIPRDGAIPLSTTLDSVGTIARSVPCCTILDTVLSNAVFETPRIELGDLKLLVPRNFLLEDMDEAVSNAFERALRLLNAAGCDLVEEPFDELSRISTMNAKGGFPAAESYAWHREIMKTKAQLYDPRVLQRIQRGAQQTEQDYLDLCIARIALIREAETVLDGYDAMIFPTVPILPPEIAALQDEALFSRINLLVLRNSTVVNMIDGCAISIPVGGKDDAPVGLTIAGRKNADHHILACAAAVEELLDASAI